MAQSSFRHGALLGADTQIKYSQNEKANPAPMKTIEALTNDIKFLYVKYFEHFGD